MISHFLLCKLAPLGNGHHMVSVTLLSPALIFWAVASPGPSAVSPAVVSSAPARKSRGGAVSEADSSSVTVSESDASAPIPAVPLGRVASGQM